MAKASNVWKLIVLSVVISLVVLAVFTAVFITMIVPAYNITREQVYTVLSRVLPILIGLVLVEIGLLVGKKGEPEYKDTIDKLTPNSYDSWLYSKPADDPMPQSAIDEGTAFARTEQAPAEVKEIIKEVPVEVPVKGETIIKEVEKPIEIKVPVEVIKEVEVPVEVIKEVPVEIVKEVIKEVPVEVIKETPVAVEEIEYDFRGALEEELSVAFEGKYPVSLIAFGKDEEIDTKIERALGANTLVFKEDEITYAILPFYRDEDAERATRLIGNKRVAMQDGRKVTADAMIKQASKGIA